MPAILRILLCSVVLLSSINLNGQYRYSYLKMGKMEYWKGNYTTSINFFNSAIDELPGYYEGYYFRALAKYALDDLIGAENDFSQAIKCLPEFPELYLLRGVVRSQRLKYKLALDDYQKALELDSTYTNVHYYRASSYFDLMEYEKALDDCNKVINKGDKYENIYVLRGLIHIRLKNYDDALTDFNKSLLRNKFNERAMIGRGVAYLEMEEANQAMLDFNHALEFDSLNVYAIFQRGLAHMKLEEYEQAMTDLNTVIGLSPDNELAYFNRALLKSNTENDMGALADLVHILKQSPDNMMVFYNLGITHLRLQNYKSAIESFTRAIELYPDYADAYEMRGKAKYAMHDYIGAEQDMVIFSEIEKKNSLKQDSVKYVESLDLMRLTNLSGDFTGITERKDKIQYSHKEIELEALFIMDISAPDLENNMRGYQVPKAIKTDYKYVLLRKSSDGPRDFKTEIENINTQIKTNLTNTDLYLKRGLYQLWEENFTASISDFNKAISLSSTNHLAYFSRGTARLKELDKILKDSTIIFVNDDFEKKVKQMYLKIDYDLNKSLETDPQFSFAFYNLAYAKFLIGDFVGSINNFADAINGGNLPEAHFNRGLLLMAIGQKEEGCKDVSRSGEMGIEGAYAVLKKYCD